jgi:glutathione peroxidase
MLAGKIFRKKNSIQYNTHHAAPLISFYNLKAITNNGQEIIFSRFKNKKVLLVNTASDCGYTGQYDELEKLHQQYKDKLVVIGFPANNFKGQEKLDDASIARFCKVNYGVSFLLMKKSSVLKGANQNEVFGWLSNAAENGWCNQQPSWNFSKYLVNEQGVLTHFFAQEISPLDPVVITALK